MTNRAIEWNEGLAKDLRHHQFAQEFIFAALDEGLELRQVLGKVIRAYGVKEFSKKVKLPSSNILRAISPNGNPTEATLSILLKPFGLRLSVADEKRNTKKKVA